MIDVCGWGNPRVHPSVCATGDQEGQDPIHRLLPRLRQLGYIYISILDFLIQYTQHYKTDPIYVLLHR